MPYVLGGSDNARICSLRASNLSRDAFSISTSLAFRVPKVRLANCNSFSDGVASLLLPFRAMLDVVLWDEVCCEAVVITTSLQRRSSSIPVSVLTSLRSNAKPRLTWIDDLVIHPHRVPFSEIDTSEITTFGGDAWAWVEQCHQPDDAPIPRMPCAHSSDARGGSPAHRPSTREPAIPTREVP